MIHSLNGKMYKGCSLLLLFISIGCANEWPEYDGPSSVTISEDEPIGALVFNFIVDDSDGDPLTVTINHDKKFLLTEVSSNNYKVTLKEKLDRETTSRYNLQVTISDGTSTTSKDVRIRLNDVNDYVPVIQNLPLKAKVKENLPAGTFIIKIVAEDEDMGYNAATEIFLDEPGPFYLGDPETGEIIEHNYDEANVLLRSPLDFEQQSLYLVKVTVKDVAGCTASDCEPSLTTTQTLTINVEDEQDTPPYFTGLPYIKGTEENLPVGSPILRVTAFDGDKSSAKDIEYYFLSTEGELVNEIEFFAISQLTGVITNSKVIDTDSDELKSHGSIYSLTVVAKEEQESSEAVDSALSQSTTPVSISIFDLNDQKPTFNANHTLGSVGEELPVGSLVTLESPLKVADYDQGVNGTFSLRALSMDGNESAWFSVSPVTVINEATISIATKQAADYETTSSIPFKIEAKEQKSGAVTYTYVTVNINDNNDNAPEFGEQLYRGWIYENSNRGAVVNISAVLKATDKDSRGFSTITYSISGGNDIFEINSTSGVVSTKCENCLDRETKSTFHLNILAADGGGLTDSAQLIISVMDVNDNRPKLSSAVFDGSVDEGSLVFTSPITVQASDEDEGRNGEISLSMLNYTDNFAILSNGTVYITSPFDAEVSPKTLYAGILASDNGVPAQTSTATLRLQVNDLNDNKPRFTHTPLPLRIAENSDIGTTVYTVTATDGDITSPNNLIVYSLSNNFGRFSIDTATGEIKLTALLDKEGEFDEYTLIILASDQGQPSKASQQTIVVMVTDVNDELPKFQQQKFQFSVSEEATVGRVIGTVQAVDRDLNSQLEFSISQSTAYDSDGNTVNLASIPVTISRDQGTITTTSSLDRETAAKFLLKVSAKDINGLTQQLVTVDVEITILDVNDNPPIIESVGMLEVTENSTDAGVITRLVVSDHDQGSQLEFSLTVNPHNAFAINNLGELRLIDIVDREVVGNWLNLTVLVRDGKNNALSSSIDIAVHVKDINDKAPRFTRFVQVVSVQEDVPVDSVLTTVAATDADSDFLNKQIEFRIKSGGDGKISIDSSKGTVSVAESLDVDIYKVANKVLPLTIEACDLGLPKLCTNRVMAINITDVNDNKPTFSADVYSTKISEIAKKGDKVAVEGNYQIEAVDIDSTPNGGEVIYTCCEPSNDTLNLFTVNAKGEVTVARDPDLLGHVGVYSLTITAQNSGGAKETGSAKVVVNVEDFNDNTPELRVLNNRSTTVHRPENSPQGTTLISIQATDKDEGDNSVVDLNFVKGIPGMDGSRYFLIERSQSRHNTFIIKQNILFDRESKAKQYRFEVEGTDRGVPARTSSRLAITVNVDDVNDNRPFFPVDKQEVEVTVREEQVGIAVGTFNYAQDLDERQLFCYSIIGARGAKGSGHAISESLIRDLFSINKMTAEIKVASDKKLDRESQAAYVLVVQADDSDENIYSDCKAQQNIPWTDRRAGDDEMEITILVGDVDDNAPVFSHSRFNLAVIRGVASPVSLINLQEYVTDADEGQDIEFSRGRQFLYTPAKLSKILGVSEPIKIYANGNIQTEITFDEEMQGTLEFTANATSSPSGLTSQTNIKVYIIDPENVYTFTVAKTLSETQTSVSEIEKIFSSHASLNVGIINLEANTEKNYHTRVQLFVVPNNTDNLLTSADIELFVQENADLSDSLYKYGYIGTDDVINASSTDEEETKSSNRVIIIAIVVAVVLLVVMLTVLILCYVMRSRYQRKLKAAHAMAFDTHTLGFEIDQADIPPSINNIPGSIKNSTPVANQGWDKDASMNNFDWAKTNGAFDSESHRSSNSHDDNAIDPLNGAETRSCSSAGSNDWRLDLRGNNLDCSPPPPITEDVIQLTFNDHHNKLNYDSKFVDSQSDNSNSTNKEDGHFNRLIMSDSVYGKIYETRRTANGLETTEV